MWTECVSPYCTTTPYPIPRCCAGLAYFNGALPDLIMYGGQDMGGVDGTHRELSGTWRFDGSNWDCVTDPCDP